MKTKLTVYHNVFPTPPLSTSPLQNCFLWRTAPFATMSPLPSPMLSLRLRLQTTSTRDEGGTVYGGESCQYQVSKPPPSSVPPGVANSLYPVFRQAPLLSAWITNIIAVQTNDRSMPSTNIMINQKKVKRQLHTPLLISKLSPQTPIYNGTEWDRQYFCGRSIKAAVEWVIKIDKYWIFEYFRILFLAHTKASGP